MSTKKILILIVIIAIVGFGLNIFLGNNNSATQQETVNDLGTLISADKDEALGKFIGKPTVIFIAGTFCPHCVASMPKYKSDIWDNYKDVANVFVNVVDGNDGGRFNVSDIPQGFANYLDFETLVGKKCDYVPSWVILNASGGVVDSSCGGAKDTDIIKKDLDELLITVTTE